MTSPANMGGAPAPPAGRCAWCGAPAICEVRLVPWGKGQRPTAKTAPACRAHMEVERRREPTPPPPPGDGQVTLGDLLPDWEEPRDWTKGRGRRS